MCGDRVGGKSRHRRADLQFHAVCDADRSAVLVLVGRGARHCHATDLSRAPMSVWLLVAGDFTTHGGMDMANFALARYLARQPAVSQLHLVSHRVAAELTSSSSVHAHIVPRPLGAHRFGEPLM